MAFALTSAYLYKIDTPSRIRKWGWQAAEFTITRSASSDTDLDIGDVAGTFWTAVGATGIGAQILSGWTNVIANAEELISLSVTSEAGFLSRASSSGLTAEGTATVNWAGGSAGTALAADSADQTITYRLAGTEATLSIPGFAAAAKGASPGAVIILKSTTLLPAALRPVADTVVRIRSKNNSAFVAGSGMAIIKTTGQIEIYYDGTGTANYTVTNDAGFDTFTVSYVVAAPVVAAGTYLLANDGTYPVIKPALTLPAASSPTSLKLVMLLSLSAQTRPFEYGV